MLLTAAAGAGLLALFLAYANGANDNYKGVATLYGSGVADYRLALGWATAATLAGSLAAALIATKLVTVFSGKGLIPDEFLGAPEFAAAVVAGAALTVFGATLVGLPISTTHAITGALAGAGFAAAGGIHAATLGKSFLLPLALSPFIPVAAVSVLGPVARFSRDRLGAIPAVADALWPQRVTAPQFHALATATAADRVLRGLHVLSAGAVCFARGLNDTPKIVGIALLGLPFGMEASIALVAAAMAIGGLVHSRRIAETMAHKITPMSHGDGAAANLVTSSVVIGASVLGMPVSTTHVSCGALFGLGLVNGCLDWRMAGGIVSAWLLTLPAAAAMAAAAYVVLTAVG